MDVRYKKQIWYIYEVPKGHWNVYNDHFFLAENDFFAYLGWEDKYGILRITQKPKENVFFHEALAQAEAERRNKEFQEKNPSNP